MSGNEALSTPRVSGAAALSNPFGDPLQRDGYAVVSIPGLRLDGKTFVARMTNPVLLQWRDVIVVKFGPISGLVAFLGFLTCLVVLQCFSLPLRFAAWWTVLAPLAMLAGSCLLPKILNLVKSPRCFAENIGAVSFTFFGGFAGAVAAGFLLARHLGASTMAFSDAGCLCIPLFHGLSRFACLSYGCCHGRPMVSPNLPAVVYTHPLSKAVRVSGLGGVRLHPVQLYEMGMNVALQVLLVLVALAAPYQGMIAGVYLVCYGLIRASLRGLRFEPPARENPHPHYETLLIAAFLAAGAGFLFASVLQRAPLAAAFHTSYLVNSLALAPAVAVMACAVMLLYGVHFRKVGRWF